jgi:hypothetical protein
MGCGAVSPSWGSLPDAVRPRGWFDLLVRDDTNEKIGCNTRFRGIASENETGRSRKDSNALRRLLRTRAIPVRGQSTSSCVKRLVPVGSLFQARNEGVGALASIKGKKASAAYAHADEGADQRPCVLGAALGDERAEQRTETARRSQPQGSQCTSTRPPSRDPALVELMENRYIAVTRP